MIYDIFIRCPDGTMQLHHDTRGLYWELQMHTITWCHEPNETAAIATVAALLAGMRPASGIDVWYQERSAR